MTAQILPSHFYGSARVYDSTPQGLTALMRGISQNLAQIAASSITPLVDDTGANPAAPTAAVAVPVPVASTITGATGLAEADLDAAAATAVQALADVVGQINSILAKVPAFGALTGPVGFVPSNTVAAITQVFTGKSAALAPQAALSTWLSSFISAYEQTRYWVNKLATATNVPHVTGSALGTVNVAQWPQAPVNVGAPNQNANFSGTIGVPALPISATDATGNGDSVLATAADALFVAITTDISALVTVLNSVVGHSATTFVVNTVAA
jgi:hypothetical protein